jgi:hypothetical protein
MTLALSYFEELYATEPDPWNFEQRWYEHRKHGLSVASLPGPTTSGPLSRPAPTAA